MGPASLGTYPGACLVGPYIPRACLSSQPLWFMVRGLLDHLGAAWPESLLGYQWLFLESGENDRLLLLPHEDALHSVARLIPKLSKCVRALLLFMSKTWFDPRFAFHIVDTHLWEMLVLKTWNLLDTAILQLGLTETAVMYPMSWKEQPSGVPAVTWRGKAGQTKKDGGAYVCGGHGCSMGVFIFSCPCLHM